MALSRFLKSFLQLVDFPLARWVTLNDNVDRQWPVGFLRSVRELLTAGFCFQWL